MAPSSPDGVPALPSKPCLDAAVNPLGTLLRSGEVSERSAAAQFPAGYLPVRRGARASEGAACRRRLEAVRALPVRPLSSRPGTLSRSGEVSERSEGAACRRLLEAVRALPVRPSNP